MLASFLKQTATEFLYSSCFQKYSSLQKLKFLKLIVLLPGKSVLQKICLQFLPCRVRHLFCNRLEEFSKGEIAEVLSIEKADVPNLLSEAIDEISKQVATEVMIIEDEPLIAMEIEQLVSELGHTISGVARTHTEAVELFNSSSPKIILADIQLADGSSGIDAVNDILKTAEIPVIFITAYPERLLTGERPEPTFLVTKPFNPDQVKALISQALFFKDTSGQ